MGAREPSRQPEEILTRETREARRIVSLAGFDASAAPAVERSDWTMFEVIDGESCIGFFLVKINGTTAELHTHLPFRGMTAKLTAFGQLCAALRSKGVTLLRTEAKERAVQIAARLAGFRRHRGDEWRRTLCPH